MIPPPLRKNLLRGKLLFNQGHFFESHEVLEEVWMETRGREKLWIQGLIQAAAGFHKLKQGSPTGAVRLLKRSADKLIPADDPVLAGFGREIETCMQAIQKGTFEWNVPKMS